MLDDPPAAQDQLQRLGVIFAQLALPSTAAAQAGGGCWLAHALARHMRRERLARWRLRVKGEMLVVRAAACSAAISSAVAKV